MEPFIVEGNLIIYDTMFGEHPENNALNLENEELSQFGASNLADAVARHFGVEHKVDPAIGQVRITIERIPA